MAKGHLWLVVLSSQGELWKLGRKQTLLLSNVRLVTEYQGVILALTVDQSVYSWSGGGEMSSTSCASLLVERWREGEMVRRVEEAAREVRLVTRETQRMEEEVQQLRVLHSLLDSDTRLFEVSVRVRPVWEGRQLELELVNTAGLEILGRCWRLLLELREAGGRLETRDLALPCRLGQGGRLSTVLPLPPLAVGELPLTLEARLLWRGEERGLVPSQVVATTTLSLLDLLAVLQSSVTPLSCTRPVLGEREAFLACLGEQGKEQERERCALLLPRTAVARGKVSWMVEAAAEVRPQHRRCLLLGLGLRRLEVEVEEVREGELRWNFGSWEPGLAGRVGREVREVCT